MKAGAVPVLVQLLSSKDKSIVDNAVWALGSIAENGAECRDFTIHCGIIQPLIALVKPTRKVGQVLTLDILLIQGYTPLEMQFIKVNIQAEYRLYSNITQANKIISFLFALN